MTPEIIALVAGAVALGTALTKIIDFLVRKLTTKDKTLSDAETLKFEDIYLKMVSVYNKIENDTLLTDDEHKWMQELHQQHNKTDADGIPLWYMPRSFIDSQREIVNILNSIYSHQEKSTYVLESVLKKLDEVDNNLDLVRSETLHCRAECSKNKKG